MHPSTPLDAQDQRWSSARYGDPVSAISSFSLLAADLDDFTIHAETRPSLDDRAA